MWRRKCPHSPATPARAPRSPLAPSLHPSPDPSPSSPPRAPIPAPSRPCPLPDGLRRGGPRGPDPSRPASASLEPGRAGRGGQSPRGLSPIITPRRLWGLPAPGNRGETRPGMPAPATFRLLGYPRRRAIGTQPSELLSVRRPLTPEREAERRRRAGLVRERPSAAHSPAACSTFSATQTQPLPGA